MTAAYSPALVTIRVPAWRASARPTLRWRPRKRRRVSPASSDAVAVLPVPVWRELLEKRWQARLLQVTELSVAFYETGERAGGSTAGAGRAGEVAGASEIIRAREVAEADEVAEAGEVAGAAGRELRRLQRRTVAARRALADTEEALSRLAAGSYGLCEQCAADIPARWLRSRPEARYCPRCSPPGLTRAAVRRNHAATAGLRPTRRSS